jgi:hypothetical protein
MIQTINTQLTMNSHIKIFIGFIYNVVQRKKMWSEYTKFAQVYYEK